ncbi:MAG: type IV pilus biogenesis/stability protein PilW [Pseudomonadota bacterium]
MESNNNRQSRSFTSPNGEMPEHLIFKKLLTYQVFMSLSYGIFATKAGNSMPHAAKIAAGLLISAMLSGCNMPMTAEVKEKPLEVQAVDRIAALNTQLGIGYLREGRNELAYKKLSRALEIQPDYSGAHNAIALLYERLGQVQHAEKHYRSALDFTPQDSQARTNFGSYLCRHKRLPEALEQFEAALSNPLYDSRATALTNAGLCLYRSGEVAQAEEYLRRALDDNPRTSAALLTMGEISAANGRELSARGYLQRYLENGRHSPQSLWLGVRIENVLGDRNAASSYALLLKANYPDSRETQQLLQSEAQ